MSKDHLDLIREFFRAFNAADAVMCADFYDDRAETDGVILQPSREHPVHGRTALAGALRTFFATYEGSLDGGLFTRVRAVARLETGRGWVHAEWVAGLRARDAGPGGPVHHLTGYTHFFIGAHDTIQSQRSIVQPAGDDAVRDVPVPPPVAPGSRKYPSRPIVGVGAVIFVDSKVVLIKRRFEPLAGQWSLPGGTLEVGETLEAGTAREILEETGLVVEVGPVIEVFDRILLDEDRKVRYHFVLVDYLCRPVGGRLQHGSDVGDAILVDPDQLEPYGLTPKATSIVHKAIDMIRSGATGNTRARPSG
jgi:8-oxo-dGTP diphosphatase